METETLVTQFTCDRGGMICGRPPDPEGTYILENLSVKNDAADCLT